MGREEEEAYIKGQRKTGKKREVQIKKASPDKAVFGNEIKAYIISVINGSTAPSVGGSVSTTTASANDSATKVVCASTDNASSQQVKAKNLLKEILRKAKE